MSSARLGSDLPACLHDHRKRSPQLGDVFRSEEIAGCFDVVGTCRYPSRQMNCMDLLQRRTSRSVSLRFLFVLFFVLFLFLVLFSVSDRVPLWFFPAEKDVVNVAGDSRQDVVHLPVDDIRS